MDLQNTESSERESIWCQWYTYTSIFLCLYAFEEIFFDIVFKYVDVFGGFQVRCETVLFLPRNDTKG